MPHTSRRTRPSKPSNAKRAVLELEDGWSRVEYGYRTDDRGSAVRTSMKMPPADPDLTVEKMREEHERVKSKWIGSAHRKSTVDALERVGPEQWDVSKAVCVALGSLSTNWHNRIRSVYQFAYFMDILDIVKANNKHDKIQVFVQEPRFTALDHEFFKSMGISVLTDPAAQAEVGDHTFFFAPCLEWSSEIPYLQQGAMAPLYITSSASWIYDEAQRCKNSGHDVKMCLDAMEAADTLRRNHHCIKFTDGEAMEDSLRLTMYVVTDKDAQEEDGFDIKDLAASIGQLTV